MTTEEQIFVHYAECYAVARLATGVATRIPYEKDEPREAAACLLGVHDGASQAPLKTKTQLVQAVEALLV
jgi:hypothetical protein